MFIRYVALRPLRGRVILTPLAIDCDVPVDLAPEGCAAQDFHVRERIALAGGGLTRAGVSPKADQGAADGKKRRDRLHRDLEGVCEQGSASEGIEGQ